MFLQGKKVTLRALEEEDLEFVRSLINDPDLERTIVGWTWPKPKKDQEQWFMNYSNSEKVVRYIIETKEDGVVGMTGIRDIDWKNGSAAGGGIRIRKDLQAKGIATDVYMTLLRFAFDELRLHRFTASAFDDNTSSVRFMEKCGFKREGVFREAIFKEGKYKNLISFAILRDEYEEVAKKYWNGE